MIDQRCPHCCSKIVHPAREGGYIVKARYARQAAEGPLVHACGVCGGEFVIEATELRRHGPTRRVVLRVP
jgi:DNA-directed RNA polymerase subunit RPC12/RpoP